MRILKTADVHVEHASQHKNSAGEAMGHIVIDEMIKTARQERVQVLTVLGDLFDAFGEVKGKLASYVKDSFISLARDGVKIVIIAGNHDYERVEDYYFAGSIVHALFSNLESLGIYVIDDEARFIELDEKTVFLGLPYRETYEQFERDCLTPIKAALGSGITDGKRVVTGWHCGLPFGEKWAEMAGDEKENAWIKAGHPAIELLFEITTGRRIFLGHYHTPGDIPCGSSGTFTYVGSPATRSRSESEEVKRFLILEEEGATTVIETGLNLDKKITSVKEGESFVKSMVSRFGARILPVLRLSLILPEGSRNEDYQVALSEVSLLPVKVKVDRPVIRVHNPMTDLIEKLEKQGGASRAKIDVAVALRCVIDYFRGKAVSAFEREEIETVIGAGSAALIALAGDSGAVADEKIQEFITRLGIEKKKEREKLAAKLTADAVAVLVDVALHYEEMEDVARCVTAAA